MATNNESLKLELEGCVVTPKIIIIGAPLNEVAFKISKNSKRGKDETVRSVVEEQNKIVSKSASEKDQCLHLIVPPFLRQEPKWIEEKVKLCLFYQKEFIEQSSLWNVAIGNPVQIDASDLQDDKLHLTNGGAEKLYQVLESDILKCKVNLGEGQETVDWSQVSNTSESAAPTPSTLRKRPRTETEMESDRDSESGGDEVGGKRAKLTFKNSVLDKLTGIDMVVKQLWNERLEAKAGLKNLNEKVDLNTTTIDEIATKVSKLEEAFSKEDQLTAEMREDIDGLENENLKSTVIVRKLKAKEAVPKDKKLLRSHIRTLARKLVAGVLGG